MNASDFDIKGLATYLHLSPDQVTKLASRGKIPGRRIGGEWRFAAAEVHHWLEERIGVSDDDELSQVENVLHRAEPEDNFNVADMLPIDATEIPLSARTQASVIHRMVENTVTTGLMWDAPKMIEAVKSRESLHPTALDNGVAMLHPRRPMPNILAEPIIGFGRTHQGIPFGAGCLTDIFFLICSIDDRGHLKTLARLSRLLAMDGFVATLREIEDWQALTDLIREREATIDGVQ